MQIDPTRLTPQVHISVGYGYNISQVQQPTIVNILVFVILKLIVMFSLGIIKCNITAAIVHICTAAKTVSRIYLQS